MYSRVFRSVPRLARRVHFFGCTPDGKALSDVDLYSMSDAFRKAYLGYAVIRPLHAFRVGDTVLKSPRILDVGQGGKEGHADLVHCLASFEVSLLGNRPGVRGMPFIQQETSVGVCAQADLWMVARYLNKLGETRRYRPGEISELAMRSISLGPAREGLIDIQMLDTLRQMGLNPTLFTPRDWQEAAEFIYTCVESELPVIAGIPDHVVLVIGHGVGGKGEIGKPFNLAGKSLGLYSMSQVVSSFVAHDDASGPYREMKVGSRSHRGRSGVTVLELEGNPVDFCLVALPQRVNMTWQDVLIHTKAWLEEATEFVARQILKATPDQLWTPEERRNLVIRAYLRRCSQFKEDIVAGPREERRHEDIIAKYMCMPMPKYVWVVELARLQDIENREFESRVIVGEILIDSTASPHVPEQSVLAFHLNGAMYAAPQDEASAMLLVRESRAYRPLRRSQC